MLPIPKKSMRTLPKKSMRTLPKKTLPSRATRFIRRSRYQRLAADHPFKGIVIVSVHPFPGAESSSTAPL